MERDIFKAVVSGFSGGLCLRSDLIESFVFI
jgi:hypothetical protein